MENTLITIKNCRIENNLTTLVPDFSWEMKSGEAWLVIGPNGGGKADFLNALSGQLKIVPNTEGLYSNIFNDSTEIVSLERAARLIQEERENDESEYIYYYDSFVGYITVERNYYLNLKDNIIML